MTLFVVFLFFRDRLKRNRSQFRLVVLFVRPHTFFFNCSSLPVFLYSHTASLDFHCVRQSLTITGTCDWMKRPGFLPLYPLPPVL